MEYYGVLVNTSQLVAYLDDLKVFIHAAVYCLIRETFSLYFSLSLSLSLSLPFSPFNIYNCLCSQSVIKSLEIKARETVGHTFSLTSTAQLREVHTYTHHLL